jgi:DNA polymerase-1
MSFKKVVLVDGSSYLFRAYHALPPLTTREGTPTGAMLGSLNMIQKLLKEEEPAYMAVIFDSPQKTMRHEWFEDYKANRIKMPEELAVQIAPLHQMIIAMGIPLIVIPGIEADDIIGSMAYSALKAGLEVVISTGDKDFAQLVQPGLSLVNTMSGEYLDTAGVLNKFGVGPSLIADYLSLVGDTSDNVPGVSKVGPKTAVKWLNQYGSLDNIILKADEIPGKIGQYLRDALDWLPQAKRLVTIYTDIKLDLEPGSLIVQAADTEQLRELWTRYEFKSWLAQLAAPASVPETKSTIDLAITEIQSIEQLDKVFADKTLALLLELEEEQLTKIYFSGVQKIAYSLDLKNVKHIFAALNKLFLEADRTWIGYDLKKSLRMLAANGFKLQGILRDIKIGSYVLNSIHKHDYSSLIKANMPGFAVIELRAAHEEQQALLTMTPALLDLYENLESPLIRVLWEVEDHGVLIDPELLIAQSKRLGDSIHEITEQAYIIAGEEFNLSSPKQLQVILFEKLGLPALEKTPTGQASTGESVLAELALTYELPKLILKHRTLSKLKSTYTDKLPLQADAQNRVHTHFQQALTATGRLSSQDPNLQNIPIRTEEGSTIREAFIAPPGFCLLSADYSQIELRIMAHLSEDPGLVKAFQLGLDVHKATASEIFEVPLDEVNAEQRRYAKTINFGLIYGMSSFGLAKQLEVSREEADAFIKAYFVKYPKVQQFMKDIREKAYEQGYVETLLGRRLYLPELKAKNYQRRQAAERAAINAPMQGTAADIIKRAMLRVQAWCTPFGDNLCMVLQVHDELLFEIKESLLAQAKIEIPALMESVLPLSVPLVVDVGVGPHWRAAH